MSQSLQGNIMNRFGERTEWRMPIAGEGATELCYTDRVAYTVTRTTTSGKTFWAREDDARRVDHNGMSDVGQRYEYATNPANPEVEVRWTGKGWKKRGGSTYFRLGSRNKFHDFSF